MWGGRYIYGGESGKIPSKGLYFGILNLLSSKAEFCWVMGLGWCCGYKGIGNNG